MHKYLVYAAYGWLTLGGTLHFLVDVVSQHLRRKRTASSETTLYYGLNTAYALGQVLFGLLGLSVARQALIVLGQWPAVSLTLAAAASWLIFSVIFIEYSEPRVVVGIFGALAIAAAITS
jgi:hypothetical protein